MDRRTFVKIIAGLGAGALLPARRSIATEQPNSSIVPLDSSLSEQIALNFLSLNYRDLNISIENTDKYCREIGKTAGYVINLSKDKSPYGYIVIDPSAKGYIQQFSLNKGAISPTRMALTYLEKAMSTSLNSDDRDSLVFAQVSPFEFLAVSPANSYAAMNSGDCFSGEMASLLDAAGSNSVNPSEWEDIFVDLSVAYSKWQLRGSGTIRRPLICVSEAEIEQKTSSYACLVTALYATAEFYGIIGDVHEDWWAYNELWDRTGTSVDAHSSDGTIRYGSTNIYNMSSFVDFASDRGVTISQSTPDRTPSFTSFSSQVSSQQISIAHVWIQEAGSSGFSGHSMMVWGFRSFQDASGNSTLNVLDVYDGWNEWGAAVNFDFADYANFRGTFFQG